MQEVTVIYAAEHFSVAGNNSPTELHVEEVSVDYTAASYVYIILYVDNRCYLTGRQSLNSEYRVV